MHATIDHATAALAEADRLMTVCNSCRYCEGLCAVFPAMEMRHAFGDGDLNYLANLCHGCGACYYDCQFSPPHEFDVNVPRNLARVRADSYASYVWPRGLFRRGGLAVGWLAAVACAAFSAGFIGFGASLFDRHVGAGAFYTLMSHDAMALLFGAVLLFAIVALGLSLRAFLRDAAPPAGTFTTARWLRQALRDAAHLTYLDGGGVGCMNDDDRPVDRRRLWHHFTAYGFLLCIASTSVATLYHYLLGREAPYPWFDLPVVLGTLGGLGLVVGPIGLLRARLRRDPAVADAGSRGMDVAFTSLLLAAGGSGLALLLLRATALMGPLLALHLGIVLALFVTLPYGKFVHGLYRFAALVIYAREREGA